MAPAEYCKYCPAFFQQHGACHNPQNSILWVYITLSTFYIPLLSLLVVPLTRRLRDLKPFIYMNFAYFVTNQCIKSLFQDPRPLGACKHGFGMPSAHTTKIAIFLMLRLVYSPYLWEKVLWSVVTLLVGISRLELNYHYPLQVAMGAVTGIILFFVFDYVWSFADAALPSFEDKADDQTQITDQIEPKPITQKS